DRQGEGDHVGLAVAGGEAVHAAAGARRAGGRHARPDRALQGADRGGHAADRGTRPVPAGERAAERQLRPGEEEPELEELTVARAVDRERGPADQAALIVRSTIEPRSMRSGARFVLP